MADAYWRYGESRQQANLPPLIGKRPRSDYDVPSGHELPGYFTRDDERAAHRVMRDTDSIGASYDRYLRSAQISSYGGGDSARPLSGGLSGRPADDARIIGIGGSDPAVIAKNRPLGLGDGRPELPLPPDATNTLFVEGLPANCTRREVSHIFRPFVGYKEARLVTKESRHSANKHCNYFRFADDDDNDVTSTDIRTEEINDLRRRLGEMDNAIHEHDRRLERMEKIFKAMIYVIVLCVFFYFIM
ncbi:hypothetical protein CsSME_00002031 [Camellia sinensis var. sinensis]